MRKRGYTVKRSRRYSPGGGYGSTPGYRRRRLQQRQRARKRRLAAAIMTGGIILSVVLFLAVFWVVRFRSSANSSDPGAAPIDTGQNIIMTAKDESGRLSQILVVVPGQQGGYSVYTIPPRTLADTPGYGFQRLDAVPDLGGQQLLDQTLANLLQVPIRYHVSFDYGAVELAANEAGTINFKADQAMATADQSITFNQGDNPTGAKRALQYLKASVNDGQAGPRIQALFYLGLHDAFVGKPELDRRNFARQLLQHIDTDMGDGFVDLFVNMTTAGQPFGVWPLPVKMSGSGTTWYLEPEPDQLQVLMTGTPQDAGINLEIRNGTSTQGVVEAAATKLAPLRYNITINPEPSGVAFDNTQIRCGTEALKQGNAVHDVLGKGTIIKDETMEKQQIIVIIGGDLSLPELQ